MEEPDDVLAELDQKLAAHVRVATEMGRSYWVAKKDQQFGMQSGSTAGGAVDSQKLMMARTALYQPQHDRWWQTASDDDIAQAMGLATRFFHDLPEARLVFERGEDYLHRRLGSSNLGPATASDVEIVGRDHAASLEATLSGEAPSPVAATTVDSLAPEEAWRGAKIETDVARSNLNEEERRAHTDYSGDDAGVGEADSRLAVAENHEGIMYDSMARREAKLQALTPVVGAEAAHARVTAEHGFSQPASPGDGISATARSRTASLRQHQRQNIGRARARTRVN